MRAISRAMLAGSRTLPPVAVAKVADGLLARALADVADAHVDGRDLADLDLAVAVALVVVRDVHGVRELRRVFGLHARADLRRIGRMAVRFDEPQVLVDAP